MHFKRYRNAESGFTLIEIMATLVILTLITVIAIPTIGTIIDTAGEKSEARSVDMIEHAGMIADTAGLQHDRKGQYDVMTLMDKGYLDLDWDSELVDPTTYVEKDDTATGYIYYGKGSYGDADEDSGLNVHDRFEIQSFVRHADVTDGVGPFSEEDGPGLDTGDSNGIVRTWDTVTYPINVTVNSKTNDVVKNIKVKLSGTLHNGTTDGNRVNAKFAVGGTESLETETVSFEQDYTIAETGRSIMIPITIEVLGAPDGLALRPDIQVQVMSVDGENIKDAEIKTTFDALPEVTTSAAVSLEFKTSNSFGTGERYAIMSGNRDDMENMHSFALNWGLSALPGHDTIKGATFPDPKSKILYEVEHSGFVNWTSPFKRENFDYSGRDTPHLLLDHRDIEIERVGVGQKNMLLEGEEYTYSKSNGQYGPLSDQAVLSNTDRRTHHSVWDSGDWAMSAPEISDTSVKYSGSVTNFAIGSTFPEYRADGYTGSKIWRNDTEKLFASQFHLALLPNEYRYGGENNPEGLANSTHYATTVTYKGYIDEDGVRHQPGKPLSITRNFTDYNNPTGSFYTQSSILRPDMSQIGTRFIGDTPISKGDASTTYGSDVKLGGYVGHQMAAAGGFKVVATWNTDAFRLSAEGAAAAEKHYMNGGYYDDMFVRVRNDADHQTVRYGVPKFTDNSFESLTAVHHTDYDWYDSFDEAISHGEVGAMMNDVNAATSKSTMSNTQILLHPKYDNIDLDASSETKDGTPNITVLKQYAYIDKERTHEHTAKDKRGFVNPAKWRNGEMIERQAPYGSKIPFETLAVTPAETHANLIVGFPSYYNTDVMRWRGKTSIRTGTDGILDDYSSEITATFTLPEGINYRHGSAVIGSLVTEPEINELDDGVTELVFTTDHNNGNVEDIVFETTTSPAALDPNTAETTQNVSMTLSSEVDKRPKHLRSSDRDVTILKAGTVGIFGNINEAAGSTDSSFELTFSPYSALTDERGVVGITTIPQNGDPYGSKFSGTTTIESIEVLSERKHQSASTKIYLNDTAVYDLRPHNINELDGGWIEYTGDEEELLNAKSILFKVNGLLTSVDDIEIKVGVKTHGNAPGDTYYNEAVINSAMNYTLSPTSHRVNYTIE